MRRNKWNNTWSKQGISLEVTVALGTLMIVEWTFMQGRFQSGSSPNIGMTIGIGDMPQSLDIWSDPSAATGHLLVDNIYEILVTIDQDNKFQPGLATSWKTSDGGLTITLTLQPGVTFSDGHTLDTSDATWSLQQNVTNKVADVDELGSLAPVANPNATTVVVTFVKPDLTLLQTPSGRLGIAYDSESPSADYQRKAIGPGPFTVADFQLDHSLKLTHNDTYHDTKVASNVAEFMQYSDTDALSKALTDGSLGMAASVSVPTATGLSGKDGLTVKKGATTDRVLLAYSDGTDSLLSNEQARKALRCQIDTVGITSARPDAAGALGGPINLLEPGYEDLTGLYPHDKNQTGQMFSYSDAQYLTTMNLMIPEEYRLLAETTKQQIERQPRPTVDLEAPPDGDYVKRIKDDKRELTMMDMNGTDNTNIFTDPDSIFHYGHTEAQQAYADAHTAINDVDYEAWMKACTRLISKDVASDWLYIYKCFTVASAKVSNYPTSTINRRIPPARLTARQVTFSYGQAMPGGPRLTIIRSLVPRL